MRFRSILFLTSIITAVFPVLSAPAPVQAGVDVQYRDPAAPPGLGTIETRDVAGHMNSDCEPECKKNYHHTYKRSMPDSDTFDQLMHPEVRDIGSLPEKQQSEIPGATRTYSRRMNLEGISKVLGFFRDAMDEGVALDATTSDAHYLSKAN